MKKNNRRLMNKPLNEESVKENEEEGEKGS